MITILLALAVGMLFATGTYMILRRGQIKLILGLALLSHGVNLLLFGSGPLVQGSPPIFLDKSKVMEDLAGGLSRIDPLPQALILTAIVISFGITAFVILLVNRRHTVAHTDVIHGELMPLLSDSDPFYVPDDESEDELINYWLSYEISDEASHPEADPPRATKPQSPNEGSSNSDEPSDTSDPTDSRGNA